jgi:hypothetical protein
MKIPTVCAGAGNITCLRRSDVGYADDHTSDVTRRPSASWARSDVRLPGVRTSRSTRNKSSLSPEFIVLLRQSDWLLVPRVIERGENYVNRLLSRVSNIVPRLNAFCDASKSRDYENLVKNQVTMHSRQISNDSVSRMLTVYARCRLAAC